MAAGGNLLEAHAARVAKDLYRKRACSTRCSHASRLSCPAADSWIAGAASPPFAPSAVAPRIEPNATIVILAIFPILL